MTEPKFKLETSKTGIRILTVWYRDNGWEAAITSGLAAAGLGADDSQRLQIIALPESSRRKATVDEGFRG